MIDVRFRITSFDPWHQESLNETRSLAYPLSTLLLHDRPVALFGGYFATPGTFHCWSLISDEAKKNPKSLVKISKAFIDFFIEKNKIRRLQITVDATEPGLIRWAEVLGFKNEGRMTAYGPEGHDHWLFARTEEKWR